MAGAPFDLAVFRQTVGLVSMAAASNDMIPAMSQLWAYNGSLVGFNDDIAISHPLDLKLTGTLHAATLARLLGTFPATADKTTYEATGGRLILRSGKTRATLACGSAAKPLFDFPAGAPAVEQVIEPSKLRDRLLKVLYVSLVICDRRAVTAEFSAPMIWQDGDDLVICGTDGKSLVQKTVPLAWGWPATPQVFPHDFYRALHTLTADDRAGLSFTWRLYGNSSLIEFEDGVRLWGRRLPLRHRTDYAGLLPGILEKPLDFFQVPKQLPEAVSAHAAILRGVHVGLKHSPKRIVELAVADGQLLMRSGTAVVTLRNKFRIADFKGEPITIWIDAPKLDFILQAVTEERGLLAITSRVLLARGPGKVYFLLAGKGAPEDEEADDDGD